VASDGVNYKTTNKECYPKDVEREREKPENKPLMFSLKNTTAYQNSKIHAKKDNNKIND
jgi:hypothetical protein